MDCNWENATIISKSKNMQKHRFTRIKSWRFINVGILVLGIVFLAYSVYQIPAVKNKLPWFNNQILAYKYERMAKKLPPGDVKAKRLWSMAKALRGGNEDYQFQTGPLPSMSH